jgi:CheY-like chemotaxis protein/phosphoribosyl 1,2-cyclic phosphodiesterase
MMVRFWGTRGSIASPGPSTNRYGGNTSCVEIVTNSGKRFICDCGTGARALGGYLLANAPKPVEATILLSHTHWDHIQGFPFFAPVFIPGNRITVCGPKGANSSLPEVLSGQMEFTYFPVELEQLGAEMKYRDLTEGVHDFDGVRVTAQFLNHPAVTLGYRIEADGVSVLYLCDHEPYWEPLWRSDAEKGLLESILHPCDRRHAEFMNNADVVIHDAQYTPEEYPAKKNWGHSTYSYVVELAAAAGVKQLALIHHDPTHNDEKVLEIERLAQEIAARTPNPPHVFCAYEGGDLTIKPQAGSTVAQTAAPVAGTKSEGRRTVLVVDDDENIHLLAEAALSKEYTVITAADGEECLRAVRDDMPDMVILDLNMPKMDGLTVLNRLRGEMNLPGLPVLVLTASGDESNTRAAFEAGATDYLTKPFTIPQLMTRVTTCFARAV